jgi:hypothetical protein
MMPLCKAQKFTEPGMDFAFDMVVFDGANYHILPKPKRLVLPRLQATPFMKRL